MFLIDQLMNELRGGSKKKIVQFILKPIYHFNRVPAYKFEILNGNKNSYCFYKNVFLNAKRKKNVLSIDFDCHNKSIFISLFVLRLGSITMSNVPKFLSHFFIGYKSSFDFGSYAYMSQVWQ